MCLQFIREGSCYSWQIGINQLLCRLLWQNGIAPVNTNHVHTTAVNIGLNNNTLLLQFLVAPDILGMHTKIDVIVSLICLKLLILESYFSLSVSS